MGLPDIKFYFKEKDPGADASPTEVRAVREFRAALRGAGVLDWSFTTLRQFRSAARIHLSRYIQKQKRQATTSKLGIPPVTRGGLATALKSLSTHLDRAKAGRQIFLEHAPRIAGLASGIATEFRTGNEKLRRIVKPGFRKPSGGHRAVQARVTEALNRFAHDLRGESQEALDGYSEFIEGAIQAIVLVAPLEIAGRLSERLRRARDNIADLGVAVRKLRETVSRTREAIGSWAGVDRGFDAAKREVLAALDAFDDELSGALRTTRELELFNRPTLHLT